MDKFRRIKNNEKKLKDEADLFAETVDKIARERAGRTLLDGKPGLFFDDPKNLIANINKEIEIQYALIQNNYSKEEMEWFYTGFKILHTYWIKRDEIDIKLEELLGNPKTYIDFDEFTTALVMNKSLEKIIKALSVPMSEFEEMMKNE